MCASQYLPGRGLDVHANYGWMDVLKKQEKERPTLRAEGCFDEEEDCKRLKNALDGNGSDKDDLVTVLSNRNAKQRVKIVQKYISMYGEDIITRFESELRGNFEDCILALCYTPAEFDAIQLDAAVKADGTDEDALIEILCTRSNQQIQNIKEVYTKLFPGKTLEDVISGDVSGKIRRLLVALLRAKREETSAIDQQLATQDATELHEAGENRFGTDESKFIQVLSSRSDAHLKKVINIYQELSGQNIKDIIQAETSGTFRTALLTIVSYLENKNKYFAEQLMKSMKGLGTNDRALIRIIVSRCEVDLADIMDEFEHLNGDSLCSWIECDASGRYRKLLLALCGQAKQCFDD